MLEAIGARSSLEIEKHLKYPPSTSVIIQIDPKTAEEILADRNKGNRPPKPNKVQQFVADMENNRWGLTGDTIKFGTDGRLLDGQNRLSAAFEAVNLLGRMSSLELIRLSSAEWILESRAIQGIYCILLDLSMPLHSQQQ